MLVITGLISGYKESGFSLRGISFLVSEGELVGIIGPNGSGKSTLLKTISRVLKHKQGSIQFAGKEINEYNYQELARKIAVVTQRGDIPAIGLTVREFVLLGRIPYWKRLQLLESKHDHEVAQRMMAAADVLALAERDLSQLSGGEHQRAVIARALCQEPQLLLLDEPTTHLDLGHQREILDLVKKMNRQGITVIMVVHDLNLAAAYCDRLLLLANGRIRAEGRPEDILRAETIAEVYRTPVVIAKNPATNKPLVCLTGPGG